MKQTRLARARTCACAEHPRTPGIDQALPFGRGIPQPLREQIRALPRSEIEVIPDKRDVSKH
jgi:hypothetical protein